MIFKGKKWCIWVCVFVFLRRSFWRDRLVIQAAGCRVTKSPEDFAIVLLASWAWARSMTGNTEEAESRGFWEEKEEAGWVDHFLFIFLFIWAGKQTEILRTIGTQEKSSLGKPETVITPLREFAFEVSSERPDQGRNNETLYLFNFH